MIHIILYQPEIPPNTGNVIRLCANMGAQLHLIKPLAFDLDDKKLRRAGLDYHEFNRVMVHENINGFMDDYAHVKLYALTTKGVNCYTSIGIDGDVGLLFGPETRGLPDSILTAVNDDQLIRIPMQANSRSLNLSNSVAIVAYDVWRRLGFSELT